MNKKRTPEQKLRVALKHEGWAHGKVRLLDIRKGDTVEVIAGKDKGKRGVVQRTLPAVQRIVVEGVHLSKRHTRANQQQNQTQGGIVDFNAPFAYSNVQLVCPRCDKRTRIRHQFDDAGAKHLQCTECGERVERVTKA
jgi:large subunit ribosomal protein L24